MSDSRDFRAVLLVYRSRLMSPNVLDELSAVCVLGADDEAQPLCEANEGDTFYRFCVGVFRREVAEHIAMSIEATMDLRFMPPDDILEFIRPFKLNR